MLYWLAVWFEELYGDDVVAEVWYGELAVTGDATEL